MNAIIMNDTYIPSRINTIVVHTHLPKDWRVAVVADIIAQLTLHVIIDIVFNQHLVSLGIA
jgi:hypothetical protein